MTIMAEEQFEDAPRTLPCPDCKCLFSDDEMGRAALWDHACIVYTDGQSDEDESAD